MGNEGVILASDGTPYEVAIRQQLKKSHFVRLHVEPESFETKTLSDPAFATPTNILGVAEPLEPEVESNVTQLMPILSLLYPYVSVGSGT